MRPVPAAVRAIGMHLARLRRVITLHRAGAGLPEAAKAAGVFWKNEREFLRQARTWSLPELDKAAGRRPGRRPGLQADRLSPTT